MSIACWMGKFQRLVVHYAKVGVILLGAYLRCHQHARMALRSLRSMAWYHLRWPNPLVWISVTVGLLAGIIVLVLHLHLKFKMVRPDVTFIMATEMIFWTSKRKEEGSFTSEEDMHGTSEHGYLEYIYKTHKKNKMWNILHVPSFSITWRW